MLRVIGDRYYIYYNKIKDNITVIYKIKRLAVSLFSSDRGQKNTENDPLFVGEIRRYRLAPVIGADELDQVETQSQMRFFGFVLAKRYHGAEQIPTHVTGQQGALVGDR